MRARCLSASSTPKLRCDSTIASSWRTCGVWFTTTWFRTGTGSSMTSHSPFDAQLNIQAPRERAVDARLHVRLDAPEILNRTVTVGPCLGLAQELIEVD